jgi:hypothetical protein
MDASPAHAVSRRVWVSVLAAVSVAGACFQNLDPNASSGAGASATPASDQPLTSWQLCQAPSCDSPDGAIPVLLDTPAIYLADGGTTANPCDDIEARSLAIRQAYCAGCHAAPASQAGLGFILDDGRLASALSQTAILPDGTPQRLVVPGSPYGSRLYQRVAAGLSRSAAGMPPAAQPGYPVLPRPSVSDVSVLYAWIMACVPGATQGSYASGGAVYGPRSQSEADGGGSAGGSGEAGTAITDAGDGGEGGP